MGAPDPEQLTEHDPPQTSRSLEIRLSANTIWQAIGAILITLGLLWALGEARTLVGMVLISFFFSLALEPIVLLVTGRYGWRRGAAVGVAYLAGAAFVGFMIVILIPAVSDLGDVIGDRGDDWLTNVSEWTEDNLDIELTSIDSAADLATAAGIDVDEFAQNVFGSVLGFASSGIGLVFNLATVAMFTFYFSAGAPQLQRAVLKLFSPAAQERIAWTWDQAITQTGGYFYSRLILMFINGTGFFLTMVLVGLPTALALSLALIGAFISVFIPAVGTYIGGAIPIIFTLAIEGIVAALIVLGYVLVYQQLENYWLSPKISSKTMTLNGGLAFGAALAGGAIAGPMGAFTALPIAALITSFVSNYIASHEVVVDLGEKQDEASTTNEGKDKE